MVKAIDVFGNDMSQAYELDLPMSTETRQAGVK